MGNRGVNLEKHEKIEFKK